MADKFWIGGNSESWTDGQNWSGGAAPSANDVIYFARATRFSPIRHMDQRPTNFSQIIALPPFRGTLGTAGEPLRCACDWFIWNSPGSCYISCFELGGPHSFDRIHVSDGLCRIAEDSGGPATMIVTGGDVELSFTWGGGVGQKYTQSGAQTKVKLIGEWWSGATTAVAELHLIDGELTLDRTVATSAWVMGGTLKCGFGAFSGGGNQDHRILGGTLLVNDSIGEDANQIIKVYEGGKIDCMQYTGAGVVSGRLYVNRIDIYGGEVDLRNGTEQITINTGIYIKADNYKLLVDSGQKWTVADQ